MLIRPLSLLISCVSCFIMASAHADLYVYGTENPDTGIHLSNVPVDAAYRLLIAEPPAVGIPAESRTKVTTTPAHALPFDDAVRAAAAETSLEPALLHAVIAAESHHDAHALSPRGAQGLMQLMPATARRFQVSDPYNAMQNVRAGARYLQELRDLYKGDMTLALAAYNAGPEAVYRYGGRIPPYAETQRYVPKVMQLYRKLSTRQM